jgi:hypothetical protein
LKACKPRHDASVSGDDVTYYVEKYESRWRVTYEDAPIGVLDDARDASHFACGIARMQAQIGRVTWVVVLAEVEEVHRFEMGAVKSSIHHEARSAPQNPLQICRRSRSTRSSHLIATDSLIS